MTEGQQQSQPRAGIGGVLKAKPFHATFERSGRVEGLEQENWVTEMYRNRAGSVRTNLQSYDSIRDAEGKKLVILLHAQKLALIMPVSLDGSPALWGFQNYPGMRIGEATIADIVCSKVQLSNSKDGLNDVGNDAGNDAGELWTNDEYGIVLKDVKPTEFGLVIWQVKKISFEEPDPEIFKIPEGLSVVGVDTDGA